MKEPSGTLRSNAVDAKATLDNIHQAVRNNRKRFAKTRFKTMKAVEISADASNYRMVRPGIGTEAWMDMGRTLKTQEAVASTWKSLLFFWVSFEEPIGDFFCTGDSSLIGVNYSVKRAAKVWGLLEKFGELLPIEIEGWGEALILHVTHRRDALNIEHSDSYVLSNGKRVANRVVMTSTALHGEEIFRMETAPMSIFASSTDEAHVFGSEYRRCDLTGLSNVVLQTA